MVTKNGIRNGGSIVIVPYGNRPSSVQLDHYQENQSRQATLQLSNMQSKLENQAVFRISGKSY